MKLTSVKTAIQGTEITADLGQLYAAVNDVRNLASNGKRVLVHLDSKLGAEHVSQALNYSKNVRDVKKQIRRINGVLLIALLRTAKVPTHTGPFVDKKSAISYMKGMKHTPVAVY